MTSAASGKTSGDKIPIVLAVNESHSRLQELKRVLKESCQVFTSDNEAEALKIFQEHAGVDILIVDQNLVRIKGTELLGIMGRTVHDFDAVIKVLLVESGDCTNIVNSHFAGRIDYFYTKPFNAKDIKQKVNYLLARRSQEKRTSMRIDCSDKQKIMVSIGNHGKGQLHNISEKGMFLETLAYFPLDSKLPFHMKLPDESQCVGWGRVVRKGKERAGMGIQFQSLSDQSRRAIQAFLLCHAVSSSLRELNERHPFLQIEGMIAFTDKERIDFFIHEAWKSCTEITAMFSYSRIPVTLALSDVKPGEYCELIGKDLNIKFKTSDTIFVSFQYEYATYNFESRVKYISDDGNSMTCLYPQVLFYSEKRALDRNPRPEDLSAHISLPAPFDTILSGEVMDISESGVSFVTDENTAALLPGTPLESIRILKGKDLLQEDRGEVRNVRRMTTAGVKQIRYGIQFGIARRSLQTAEIPAPVRADKLPSDPASDIDPMHLAYKSPEVIRLENSRGEEIVGLMNASLPLADEPVPVILIPPAFGKTKETLFALALTLITNFYLLCKPLAVIRYDGIRRKGESYKDPEASEPPYEMVNACISQGAKDLKAVLDWIEFNPRIKASSIILVTFSLSALEARLMLRDADYRKNVDYWIPCMGTPELRHLLTRVNCGLDLLEQHQLGMELGVLPVLGNLVDVDKYMEDGIINEIATLDQARSDMKHLDIPITWIYGKHDHWVKAEFIRDAMGIYADGAREVISIPLGHNARTSQDALHMFGTVTSLTHRFLHEKMIIPLIPDQKGMNVMRRLEKDRIPARKLTDRVEYWHRYLVGEEDLLGFDVLMLADDYQQLMRDQVSALELKPSDALLDLGGGTGNLIEHILSSGDPLPHKITIADLIPEALTQAECKLKELLGCSNYPCALDTQLCDIEMNRFLPIKRFLAGEYYSFSELADKIENLTLQSVEIITTRYSPLLHRILRGERITQDVTEWLKSTFELPEYHVILDINQASRIVRGIKPGTSKFKKLVFSQDFNAKRTMHFKPGQYNKIILSLVLSYIFNPIETLIELRRILRPGGYLVISSVRPDGDGSGLFTRLVDKVEKMPESELPEPWSRQTVLKSIRSFLNDAQALVDLEEAGTFDFFDKKKLVGLFHEAGFHNTRTVETFGDPPQGYICIARVEDENV